MRFCLVTDEELDQLARPGQCCFEDTIEADIYHKVLNRGYIDIPIEE
jgi:hypothetical protein